MPHLPACHCALLQESSSDGFWFLVCYAATQLAIQIQQECIQVVRSNREARKRPTESNGSPAMDLGFEDIHMRKYTYIYVRLQIYIYTSTLMYISLPWHQDLVLRIYIHLSPSQLHTPISLCAPITSGTHTGGVK